MTSTPESSGGHPNLEVLGSWLSSLKQKAKTKGKRSDRLSPHGKRARVSDGNIDPLGNNESGQRRICLPTNDNDIVMATKEILQYSAQSGNTEAGNNIMTERGGEYDAMTLPTDESNVVTGGVNVRGEPNTEIPPEDVQNFSDANEIHVNNLPSQVSLDISVMPHGKIIQEAEGYVLPEVAQHNYDQGMATDYDFLLTFGETSGINDQCQNLQGYSSASADTQPPNYGDITMQYGAEYKPYLYELVLPNTPGRGEGFSGVVHPPVKPESESLVEQKEMTQSTAESLRIIDCCVYSDEQGHASLHDVVLSGDIARVQEVCFYLQMKGISIDLKNSNGQTALHLAILSNNAAVVQELLAFNADPSVRDRNGNTALHLCINRDAEGASRYNCFKMIIESPCSPNVLNSINDEGLSPLHLAALYGAFEETHSMLMAGVKVDAKDWLSGRTALFHAVEKKHLDVVLLLLRAKADRDAKNWSGKSPDSAAYVLYNQHLLSIELHGFREDLADK